MNNIIIIIVIIVVIITVVAIILNKSNTEDTASSSSSSSSNDIQTPASSSSNDIQTPSCNTIQKDVTTGKTIITIHVQYSFSFKYCPGNVSTINEKLNGIYDFTFTANTNSIADEYAAVKDTIPAKVFEAIKSSVDDFNSRNECKLEQGNIQYSYPNTLNVFKNDEYLIVLSNYTYDIESYSSDYPYNYINNSIVTLQSKTLHAVTTTNNILYKIWFSVIDFGTEELCINRGLSGVTGNTISPVYTNKYITFCMMLFALLSKQYITLASLGDCTATFKFAEGLQGQGAIFILSKEPYCKGVYLLTDMKDSLENFCKVINVTDGKGWTYTIDLNAAYESTPTVYNHASSKNISVFNSGSNLLDNNKYEYVTTTNNDQTPTVNCNQIML